MVKLTVIQPNAINMFMKLRFITILVTALALLVFAQIASAACTYSEAMMALKRGNETRGVALMRMAANDGDARAARYLVNIADSTVTPKMKQLILADAKSASEPLVWERLD